MGGHTQPGKEPSVRVGPEGVPFLGERGKKGPWDRVEEVRVVLRD